MRVHFHKYNRSELSPERRRFLEVIVGYSQLVQPWVAMKARERQVNTILGLRSSLFIADIIIVSDWGTHPAALPRCNRMAANNLALLKANDHWQKGKNAFEYQGVFYRSYSDWAECMEDLSDYYGWTGSVDHVLIYPDVRRQAEAFASVRPEFPEHTSLVLSLIQRYGLDEFDLTCQK